ncbi:MAG: hypothetical protein JST17_12410 [Bacteroidetes bacterium]|nr:hypothetical protein [Bacteroidota bacterium]MBS1930446.1 hypothetical protein [Bacteroidota bacterium]
MSTSSNSNFNRHFFAVAGGVFASMAAGFLIHLILHKAFQIDLFNHTTLQAEEPLNILLGFGIWLFASSMVGGLICISIAGKNDVSHIIISSLVALALYFFISGGGILKESSFGSWSILLAIPLGYFAGEWLGTANRK